MTVASLKVDFPEGRHRLLVPLSVVTPPLTVFPFHFQLPPF